MRARIRIGISSCLLGERVRYDGAHKRNDYVARTLARHFELVPVCPEVGIGMGVPRPPIELVGRIEAPRAVGRDDATMEVTARLSAFGRKQAHRLDDLSGYVFKSRSPSCGLFDVPVRTRGGSHRGRGVYAGTFLGEHPWLPAEDEIRLDDPALRDNFLERVFAFHRWQQLLASGLTATGFADFHGAHRYALMAHRASAAGDLGRIVVRAGGGPLHAAAQDYLEGFMETLQRPATPAGHERVLSQLAGFLKHRLTRAVWTKLSRDIEAVGAGRVPRARVLTALRRQFRRHGDAEMLRQAYLFPSAAEKKLRAL